MLDFQKRSKRYFAVKLANGSRLEIKPASAKTVRLMQEVQAAGDNATVDDLVRLTASIMSSNKQCKKITPDEIEETLDIDDMLQFIMAYGNFIQEIANDPN